MKVMRVVLKYLAFALLAVPTALLATCNLGSIATTEDGLTETLLNRDRIPGWYFLIPLMLVWVGTIIICSLASSTARGVAWAFLAFATVGAITPLPLLHYWITAVPVDGGIFPLGFYFVVGVVVGSIAIVIGLSGYYITKWVSNRFPKTPENRSW